MIAPNVSWLLDSSLPPMNDFTECARNRRFQVPAHRHQSAHIVAQSHSFFIFPILIPLGPMLPPDAPPPRLRSLKQMLSPAALSQCSHPALQRSRTTTSTVALLDAGRYSGRQNPAFRLSPPLYFIQTPSDRPLTHNASSCSPLDITCLVPAGPSPSGSVSGSPSLLVRIRPKRQAKFQAKARATRMTDIWRQKIGTTLRRHVAGTEFASINVAVYSPDQPHMTAHGMPTSVPVSTWTT